MTEIQAAEDIGGTITPVQVTNFPLWADGSMNVSGSPPEQIIELLSEPLVLPFDAVYRTEIVDTSRYESFGAAFEGTGLDRVYAVFEWRWTAEQSFGAIADIRAGGGSCECGAHLRRTCYTAGPEMRIVLHNSSATTATIDSILIRLMK